MTNSHNLTLAAYRLSNASSLGFLLCAVITTLTIRRVVLFLRTARLSSSLLVLILISSMSMVWLLISIAASALLNAKAIWSS